MCQQERWGALGERRRWRAYADMAALVRRRPVPAGQATSGPVPALRPMALCNGQPVLIYRDYKKKTLPKAQRTQGWVHITSLQFTVLKSWSNYDFRISIKHYKPQNLNQTSASRLKLKILTKPSFRILTKMQLHNLYKTSAAKCWTNSRFKILPELQLQNLDQALCSKSEQKFSFKTKPQHPNLQQSVANM